jgi:hypothetical protein
LRVSGWRSRGVSTLAGGNKNLGPGGLPDGAPGDPQSMVWSIVLVWNAFAAIAMLYLPVRRKQTGARLAEEH